MSSTSLMSGFRPRSLRARLLFLVFVAVVPAFALILYTARDQRRMAEKLAEENLVRLSLVVKDEHKILLEGTRQLLTVLAHLPAVRNQNPTACNALMKRIADDYPQYVGIGAIKPNGDRFCGRNFSGAGAVNIADRAWFQRTLQTGDFTIGSYQVGRVAQRAVLPVAYPAFDDSGNVRAVVLAVVDLEWLKIIAAGSVLPQGSSLTIVDNKGLILAHHPGGDQWTGKSIAGTGLERALRKGRDGLHSVLGVDGIRRFVVFGSLTGGDQSGAVHVVVSIPRQQVFAEANRILRRNLFWLALVSIAVFALAWFGGEFFVLKQVNSLLQAAQRIAGGDLKARTGLPYAAGELGQLAQSFDQMAGSLEARQEEARRAEAKARENERLASVGATAASIAHEIANPLSGMYTTVQFLERQLSQPGKLTHDAFRSRLQDLQHEIERLQSLLQDLRFLVRPDQLTLNPLSLAEVAAEIEAMERHRHNERGIAVTLDFPASLPPVMADREKIKQALLNLCKNAGEAMPKGGKLMIRAFQSANEIVLEVIDTGVGIPEEVKVFELFSTTKPDGLGLGLAIVRQIVVAHGGEISYTSEPSKGTAFRVTLPLTARAADRAA
ncbi:MAG: ATP-binding protein [Candidatus Binatia bacterium]